MGGLSAQTIALLLVLSPGFLFMLGLHTAPLTYPTRIDIQRSLTVDTAIFVVASAILNVLVGLPTIWALNYYLPCDLVFSLAAEATSSSAPQKSIANAGRCSLGLEVGTVVLYGIILYLISFVSGRRFQWLIPKLPRLFVAIYGPYYQLVQSPFPYVIADVLTKTEHEGNFLVYEGLLIELSINGSREISFVCLEGASRFYLRLDKEESTTTPREQMRRIDKNSQAISRITIPGSEVLNIVTRTGGTGDYTNSWYLTWQRHIRIFLADSVSGLRELLRALLGR